MGAAVAQVCRELGVPFLVVRGLSDRASGEASAEARRNLGVAARNAAEVTLAGFLLDDPGVNPLKRKKLLWARTLLGLAGYDL